MNKMAEMMVNTVRLLDNDQAKELAFGDDNELTEKLAIAFLNPADFDKLGLVPSLHITLKNDYGQVTVGIEKNEDVHEGTVLMPVSIYSNQITGTMDGELLNKNVKVEVEPTRDKPLSIEQLLKKIKEEGD